VGCHTVQHSEKLNSRFGRIMDSILKAECFETRIEDQPNTTVKVLRDNKDNTIGSRYHSVLPLSSGYIMDARNTESRLTSMKVRSCKPAVSLQLIPAHPSSSECKCVYPGQIELSLPPYHKASHFNIITRAICFRNKFFRPDTPLESL
jgi:hypothetical protein